MRRSYQTPNDYDETSIEVVLMIPFIEVFLAFARHSKNSFSVVTAEPIRNRMTRQFKENRVQNRNVVFIFVSLEMSNEKTNERERLKTTTDSVTFHDAKRSLSK